jgi:DNA-binding NtrC family response regulator
LIDIRFLPLLYSVVCRKKKRTINQSPSLTKTTRLQKANIDEETEKLVTEPNLESEANLSSYRSSSEVEISVEHVSRSSSPGPPSPKRQKKAPVKKAKKKKTPPTIPHPRRWHQNMAKAIEAVQTKAMNKSGAAAKFHIPRTTLTARIIRLEKAVELERTCPTL